MMLDLIEWYSPTYAHHCNNHRRKKMELKAPDTYSFVSVVKRHDAVNERFGFGVATGRAKNINEQFLDQFQMTKVIKALVETQNGSTSFHAIPSQAELVHGVNVCYVKPSTRSFGVCSCSSKPKVAVLTLSALQEQD